MRLYIDTCCYNRPYDTHAQARTDAEAVAVKAVVAMCRKLGDVIIGGFMVEEEINSIRRKPEKRKLVWEFYKSTVDELVSPSANINVRAQELQTQGLKKGDSFHLACAEATLADFLITTDVRFIRMAERLALRFVKVMNPIDSLTEIKNGHTYD